MGKLYNMPNPLRVSSYFQVLALFKSFQRRVHPTLLKQELQTIKCIKQHNITTIKLIKFVKLSTWWLLQTRGTHIWESQRFELMYTLQERTRPTRHTHPTLSLRMVPDHTYLTCSTHRNLSQSRQPICTDPLPSRRRAPDTIHNSTSSDPRVRTQLLSHNSHWDSGEKTSFYWQPATRLMSHPVLRSNQMLIVCMPRIKLSYIRPECKYRKSMS
jgi:hypothetical protein